MSFALLQLACAAIVVAYVALRVRGARARTSVARRLALLALAAWVGEDSVIRAYGFYAYDPRWSAFVDRVPLLVVLIWPVVVDSAGELARAAFGARRPLLLGLAAGAIVLADAALIEPIAVQAGLWGWSAPGAFGVPPIGVLGWAFFAAGATMTFAWAARSTRRELAVIALAPAAAHALLVVSWWGVLRWVSGPIAPWGAALAAWVVLVAAAPFAWRVAVRVPRGVVLARAPGALFFFVLLVVTAGELGPLVVYAAAFGLPYVAVLVAPR